jgi:hypothetical protein
MPPWIASLQPGEPYSDEKLKERAVLIRQSLDRVGGVSLTEEELFRFVKTYLGKYQTFRPSKELEEAVKKKVNESRQSQ